MFPTVSGDVILRFERNDVVSAYNRKSKVLLSGNEDFGILIQLCDGKHSEEDIHKIISSRHGNYPENYELLNSNLNSLVKKRFIAFNETSINKKLRVCKCDFDYPLNTVYLEPTRLCNQTCIHCYANAPSLSRLKEKPPQISIDDFSHLFHELRDMGVFYICFTGGEPFFRPDFIDILQECHSNGFDIGIFTNGSLLDNNCIKILEEIDPRFVALSLDSIVPHIYQKIRGCNCLDTVINNIQKLINSKIRIKINCILFKELNDSEASLEHYLNFLKKVGVSPSCITFDQFSPEGEGSTKQHLLVDSQVIIERVRNAFLKVYGWEIPSSGLSTEATGLTGDYCGLGTSMLNITAEGNLTLCPALNSSVHTMGNIYKTRIKKIWATSKNLKFFRDKRHITSSICLNCSSVLECQGGCKAKSLTFNGNFNQPDPWMCSYFHEHD